MMIQQKKEVITALIVGFFIRLAAFLVVFIALSDTTISFLKGFHNWDSNNYLAICAHNYASPDTPYPHSLRLYAFYPALPIVYCGLAKVLSANVLLVALCMNTVFFLLLCKELHTYIYREYEDKNLRAYIFLCYLFFPFSWFLQVNYTETLFLWLTLLSINLIYSKKIWLSHLSGFFAGFTRSTAFATAIGNWIIYTWKFFKTETSHSDMTEVTGESISYEAISSHKKTGKDIASYILNSLGFLSYGMGTLTLLAYFQFTFGNWNLFFESQKVYYGRQTSLHFWQGWLDDLTMSSTKWFTWNDIWKVKISGSDNFVDYLLTLQTFNTWFLLYFPLTLIFLGSAYLLYKKQYDKFVWSWLLLIMPIMTGESTSINRYLILSFPLLFAVFELAAKNKFTKYIWLGFSVLSWAVVASWFAKDYWVG